MRQCVTVMHADGSGYVISLTDERGSSPESVDRVRAIWHKFQDHIEAIPAPEIFEVVADWSNCRFRSRARWSRARWLEFVAAS